MINDMSDQPVETLLMHCYNFQTIFPKTMAMIRNDIVSDLKEEGALPEHIAKIDRVAIHNSWFGSKLNTMVSRLKEMKELVEENSYE